MTEWNAQAYSQISKLQEWLAEKSLTSVPLHGDERVLDLGCGDGKVTAAIAARLPGGSVLGADASHDMVTFASRTYPPSAHPNLAFRVADASHLPFAAQFDLVVSFNCLHWVRDQAAALRGIGAALRSPGRTHLRMVARGSRRSLEAVIEDTRQSGAWAQYFPGYEAPFAHFTPEEYRDLAIQAGLRVERIEIQQEAWDFATRDAFGQFAAGTFVEWTRLIPTERHLEFINDVLDRYEPKGNVFTFYQMEVTLRR